MPSAVSTSASDVPPLWMTPVSFALATVDRSEASRASSDSKGSRRPAGSYFGAVGVSALAAVVAATVPGDCVALAPDVAAAVAACRAFTVAVAEDAAAFAASIAAFGSAMGDVAGLAPGVAVFGGGVAGLPHALSISVVARSETRYVPRITSLLRASRAAAAWTGRAHRLASARAA